MKKKICTIIIFLFGIFLNSYVAAHNGKFLIITANRYETEALLADRTFFSFIPNQRSSDPNDVLFYNVGKFGNYEVVHILSCLTKVRLKQMVLLHRR